MSPATLPLEPTSLPSPLDEPLYEVVDGQIEELPPMGALASNIASRLQSRLGTYAEDNRLGRVVTEMLFVLDEAKDLKRRPDVAFVSYGRWPKSTSVPDTEAWPVVPELAIEVISPTNTAEKTVEKIGEYFQADCRRVWVVYPKAKEVYAYESSTQNTILTIQDSLDGASILPGFRLPLASLFEVEQA
jgi:Uma2 family endonuclease